MKRYSLILLYVLLLTGAVSCSKDHMLDAFKSTGPETSQTRLLPPFSSVKVGGKFDVVLIQDSSVQEQVQITAGSHIIDGITTEVSDGNLFIKNSNKVNWVRKLKTRFKVVVTLKSINKLDIEGAAKVVSGNKLKVPVLDIQHNGITDAVLDLQVNNFSANAKKAGGLILSGSTVIFSAGLEDLSHIDGHNLYTSDAYITSYSINNSFIYAEKRLGLKVYGEGNIYYPSDPADYFSKEEFGSGRVIKQ